MRNGRKIAIKDIVLTGLAAALLSAGKQALASIPNIEVVTLFIMLYAACFKPQIAFVATAVFIFIEIFIWGFNTWVFAYLIHWNLLALFTFFLARVFKIKNRFVYLAYTIVMTALFGVLTSFIDALVGWAKTGLSFATLFTAIYLRGIYFYIVHVVGNAAINITLFAPIRDLLHKLMKKYYGVSPLEKKPSVSSAIPEEIEEGGEARPVSERSEDTSSIAEGSREIEPLFSENAETQKEGEERSESDR